MYINHYYICILYFLLSSSVVTIKGYVFRLYFFGGFGPASKCRSEFQIVLEPTSELLPWPTGWNNQLAVYNIELLVSFCTVCCWLCFVLLKTVFTYLGLSLFVTFIFVYSTEGFRTLKLVLSINKI